MTKNIHLIGIGGTGLCPIAIVLSQSGYTVSGSDMQASSSTEQLEKLGIKVHIGHRAENIENPDIVIQSSAIPKDNIELITAQKKNIPVLKRSDFLSELLSGKCVIAVAGTHGKTTTTSMAAWVFTAMGLDPSFIIGGISGNLKTNAKAGKSEYFIIEADEYDHMFLGIEADWAILTNVEYDHPDFFTTRDSYLNAFEQFIGKIKSDGKLIYCDNDALSGNLDTTKLMPEQLIAYGNNPHFDYYSANVKPVPGKGCSFDAMHRSNNLASVQLQVPGLHNVQNALAVISMMHQMGLDTKQAAIHLAEFQGTERRFQITFEHNGTILIDDYAHHPTEIKTTLQAARLRYPEKRITAVWQPHTFSRSKTFFKEFPGAFQDADQVIITSVYAARESDHLFTAEKFLDGLSPQKFSYKAGLNEIIDYLSVSLTKDDVVVVCSAGDAVQINREVARNIGKND